MDTVTVDLKALLARVIRIEDRITSDKRLIRACSVASRIVNRTLGLKASEAL